MKTLIDYSKFYGEETIKMAKKDDIFALSAITEAIAEILAQDIKEVNITDGEMKALCMVYDSLLPHDWDRKSFRGIKLNRVRKLKL